MVLDLKQEVRLTQQLVLTPQLQQAIKLLQLNRLELEAVIKEELNANPLLEEVEPSPEEEPEDIPWGASVPQTYGRRPSRRKDPYEEERPLEETLKTETTLQEHLLWQLRMSPLDPEKMRIGAFLIGNIDDDGYLKISLEEASLELGVPSEKVNEVLGVIQGFDPPGVGARDLRECLLIQLRQKKGGDYQLLRRVIQEGFEELLKGDLRGLAERFGVETQELLKAIKLLKTFDTRPGRAFYPEANQYVIPDVIIYKKGEDFEVMLNDEGLPRLKISSLYQQMLRDGDDACRNYLKQKLKEAQWFLRGLEQRQKTLERITRSIVKFQREFLEKGIEYLKPLVLRDVAEDTGLHESTVSRAISGKYAWTPQGLYELKFFFSSKVGDGPVEMSSKKVKKLIEDLLSQEDPRSPLSDQDIARILKERYGLNIARRTVTKYRESLGIPSSKERRRMF
ncbi:MAG: RNA polymerase sigma-54 factor [Deltaproteobacteria bacterium]|nr:MAG: RNA polymerase sigma-54 factor [Deltaproteobacteria bacterium]